MKLCSACLLGIKCRYDGQIVSNEKVLSLLEQEILIPICPDYFSSSFLPFSINPIGLSLNSLAISWAKAAVFLRDCNIAGISFWESARIEFTPVTLVLRSESNPKIFSLLPKERSFIITTVSVTVLRSLWTSVRIASRFTYSRPSITSPSSKGAPFMSGLRISITVSPIIFWFNIRAVQFSYSSMSFFYPHGRKEVERWLIYWFKLNNSTNVIPLEFYSCSFFYWRYVVNFKININSRAR